MLFYLCATKVTTPTPTTLKLGSKFVSRCSSCPSVGRRPLAALMLDRGSNGVAEIRC
jgi:hypothetical protein